MICQDINTAIRFTLILKTALHKIGLCFILINKIYNWVKSVSIYTDVENFCASYNTSCITW